MYLECYLCSCCFFRTASNLCSSASFRPSSASVAVANVQLFKPIGVKSRSGGFDQDGQEFCDVHVMCTCGCFDDFILMKHTSWCLHADCKRRFGTG